MELGGMTKIHIVCSSSFSNYKTIVKAFRRKREAKKFANKIQKYDYDAKITIEKIELDEKE